ncbi:Bifunctional riboflavin kinase/FMN adenylyltransferase [Firmicutes bacterium ASF500]|nr:Bifunctional riboflavin kinase/FMN adenylyltransferase [Firmicutes bacterium ASF500]
MRPYEVQYPMKKQRRVIALGFFDGVHLGHGALLRAVKEAADRLDARPCAFTFDKSPTAVITGQSVPLLSTVEDRVRLMRRHYGIEEVVVAPFDAMQRMDWEDFVRRYLAEELGVVHVVAGHDFHFGYMGKGNPDRLREKCRELGMGCDIIEKVEQDGITISSTYIRTLVAQGEMERAAQFLGHPHSLTQTVTHGKGIGHSALGFPTVNLRVPEGVIVPAFGVYATRVWFDGQSRAAVTNVGVRPTVQDNDGRVTVEGFILDFDGDLYGRTVRMEFYKRLREERKFPSLEALTEEIQRNAEQTRAYFKGA